MKLLILGGGGREHALTWLCIKYCKDIFIAPGNAGTSQLGTNINIAVTDFNAIKQFVLTHQIDFVIVGPEDPIVNGIADFFESDPELKDIPILAPCKAAAQLEGSKDFAKNFMTLYGIPTAKYKTFTFEEYTLAEKYLKNHSFPLVLKADGLAAGKGVTICHNVEQALGALKDAFIENKFGAAGKKLIIEEYLEGIELSVFILTDGNNYILLPEAKDYKTIGENNTGPNTGGMGAVSPVPFANDKFMQLVKENIIDKTIQGLKAEGIIYKGFIFFGLMNVNNNPYVIEYNVRLGDPETEAIIPRVQDNFLSLMYDAAKGKLNTRKININPDYAVAVMLVSGGYPDTYEKNKIISGLNEIDKSIVFHSGTKNVKDKILTSGGRVLCITSIADTLHKAINISYDEAKKISFENMYTRKDIGKELLLY